MEDLLRYTFILLSFRESTIPLQDSSFEPKIDRKIFEQYTIAKSALLQSNYMVEDFLSLLKSQFRGTH